jgi:hypothetical protein
MYTALRNGEGDRDTSRKKRYREKKSSIKRHGLTIMMMNR